jgi:hypothetical protein
MGVTRDTIVATSLIRTAPQKTSQIVRLDSQRQVTIKNNKSSCKISLTTSSYCRSSGNNLSRNSVQVSLM